MSLIKPLKTNPVLSSQQRELLEALDWKQIAAVKSEMKQNKAMPRTGEVKVVETPRKTTVKEFEASRRKQKMPDNGFPPALASLTPELAEMARVMRKAPFADVEAARKGATKKKTKQPKKPAAKAKAKLAIRLQEYVDSLANPWGAEGARCPVSYNPTPTVQTSTARTTISTATINVNATSTTEITLFGGHGKLAEGSPMDGVAYHSLIQSIGLVPVNYSIGPVAVVDTIAAVTLQPTIGVVCSGLTLGNFATTSSLAGSSPLFAAGGGYDQTLPYSGVLNNDYHTRWKLVSMGISLTNLTPSQTRGGDVAYVQLSTNFVPPTGAQQTSYGSNPSYEATQKANTSTLKISWIPALSDMAFWHTLSTAETGGAAPSNLLTGAGGMRVWINSSTAAQQYAIQVVCNWEMGGANLLTLSSPKMMQPADKSVVEPMMECLRFSATSASSAPGIARSIVDTISPLANDAAKAGISLLGKAAGAALSSLL